MVRIVACTLSTFCLLVAAAKAEPTAARVTFGFGSISTCTKWQHEGLTQGKNWILGYWSGRNAENGGARKAGTELDDNTIIEEVTLISKVEPSLGMANAVDKVYERFLGE
jgi:carbohydrate-selective porin OprB